MQLGWGPYLWQSNACDVIAHQRVLVNTGGQRYAYHRSYEVSGYLLVGSNQADFTAQCLLLEAALAIPYQNLVLLQDDGSPSATILSNRDSLTGVLCTDGPNYTENKGSEYANRRYFTARFEAEYAFAGTGNYLLEFHESLAFSGGQPIYACQQALNTIPIRFRTSFREPYRCIQSGKAVGFLKTPKLPLPIWPNFQKHGPANTPESPARRGNIPAVYTGYPGSWSYEFESPKILVGIPHIWLG